MADGPKRLSRVDVSNAYKALFSTEDGQVVMAHLVSRFGFTRQSTFVPNAPEQSLIHEGQRTVLVEIGRQMDVDTTQLHDEEQAEGQ